jgi:hypothetical protein
MMMLSQVQGIDWWGLERSHIDLAGTMSCQNLAVIKQKLKMLAWTGVLSSFTSAQHTCFLDPAGQYY